MTPKLELSDIQGNVLLPYSRVRFPIGRFLLFQLGRLPKQNRQQPDWREDGFDAANGQRFLQTVLPEIQTAELFASKRTRTHQPADGESLPEAPEFLINLAFTHPGLEALGVPRATLNGLPLEFQEGMRDRAAILNDRVEKWLPIWQQAGEQGRIHLLLMLRVNLAPSLERAYASTRGIPPRELRSHHPAAVFQEARRLALARINAKTEQLVEAAKAYNLRLLDWHQQMSSLEQGDHPQPPPPGQAVDSPWLETESLIRSRKDDGILGDLADGSGLEAAETDLRYGEYEHFGFFDGSADPVFEGQFGPGEIDEAVIGQGLLEQGRWQPLATGEFLLGHGDQAQEMPQAAEPSRFSRHGTFLVLRQLHQDVAGFERSIRQQLPAFQRWLGPAQLPVDGEAAREQARQWLRAKLLGRWEDGTPLVEAPTYAAWDTFRQRFRQLLQAKQQGSAFDQRELDRFKRRFSDIRYEAIDRDGGRCPLTSHIRRSNPRDSGDPGMLDELDGQKRALAGSALVNRRRILRRGMTYGPRPRPEVLDPADLSRDPVDDGQERGILFIAICTGIARQFEFMQQQWLNYGSDFGAGNDICPITGAAATPEAAAHSKLLIPAPPQSDRPPFVMRPAIPAVECRGGAYFFLPSLTALRLIAQGLVDPL